MTTDNAINPLTLAVVGHTNTGKTSLLRTLLRDESFGEVANSPGTTRHVESVQIITTTGIKALILQDTPGLEDAMGLLDYMDKLIGENRQLDGPERIQMLLESEAATNQFEQEARVLNAVLNSTAALYVIDTTDPVLPKHKDELSLLAACGRPILPVLNFTCSFGAKPESWRNALARLGLHTVLDFDTVAPALDGEIQLLDKLGLMLDQYQAILGTLRSDIEQQKLQRRQAASKLIAELLIDVAAFSLPSPNEDDEIAIQTLLFRKLIKQREQKCVDALLACYQFNPAVYPHHKLPLNGERWGTDLFSPQSLKMFGIEVSKGIATGAMAGLTIDAMTGGMSLGSATLIGAIAGGSWQGINKWGKKLANYFSGVIEISIDAPVLELLAVRQLALVQALEHRGHAAIKPITELPGLNASTESSAVDTKQQASLPTELQEQLKEARANPNWAAIINNPRPDPAKERVIDTSSQILYQLI